MKTLLRTWLLIALSFFSCSTSLVAQSLTAKRFDLNLGISSTDALNIGIRYGFRQNEIGLNIGGTLPAPGFFHIISSLSYYRHLWGKSRHSNVLPWYIKGAVHYSYSESELTQGDFFDTSHAGVRLYLGRDLNFSPRLGASIASGPFVYFFEEFYDGQRLRPRIRAGVDLMLYYRLQKS